LSTTIELHLLSFGLPETFVGLFYSICTFVYFIASILEHYIVKICRAHVLIVIGITLSGIGFTLLAPWPILPQNLIAVGIGLAILGFAGAVLYSNLYLVPTTAHIIHTATTFYSIPNNEALLDSIAAATNFFCNIGEILGPLVAGILTQQFGFSASFLIIGAITALFAFIYVCISFDFRRGPDKVVPITTTSNPVEMTRLFEKRVNTERHSI
jgi:MFS family permease